MKKAIVVISFGTTYHNAMQAIENIENTIKARFSDRDFFRAFTSGMVMKKLLNRDGIDIPNPTVLFKKLKELGYDDILCQPTHVIPGVEFEKIINCAAEYDTIKIGAPLLNEEDDYFTCAEAVLNSIPKLSADEGLILMGHGTEHFANAAYSQLEQTFRFMGYENVYVATVEGFPGFDYIEKRLVRKSLKKLYLMPFMVVAGDHAQNDLAGEEEESWNSRLTALGYKTKTIVRGLGELPEIAGLFADHAEKR